MERYACLECGDTFPTPQAARRHVHIRLLISGIVDRQEEPELYATAVYERNH